MDAMIRFPIVLLTLAAALGASTPAPAAPPTLRIVDLGTLSGECCSQANAINDRGEVVGDSSVASGARHAFRWRAGTMTDLGTLGGFNSTASDINARGNVVGASELADGSTHAVLWRGGALVDLGTLGGDFSWATAVNDAGTVAGFSTTETGVPRAFVWRAGTMTELPTIDGVFSRAYDINNRGDVVGDASVDGMNSVPVRWRGTTVTSLTDRPGQGSGINDRGQVAGFYFGDGAFLSTGGRATDLGAVPGATFAQAFGLNNRGQVVGDTDFAAFLWERGVMTALPSLAGATSTATDINNRGQIAGHSATHPEGYNPHAVLWTR
jgi:probable HAF family extracellular repeat protein